MVINDDKKMSHTTISTCCLARNMRKLWWLQIVFVYAGDHLVEIHNLPSFWHKLLLVQRCKKQLIVDILFITICCNMFSAHSGCKREREQDFEQETKRLEQSEVALLSIQPLEHAEFRNSLESLRVRVRIYIHSLWRTSIIFCNLK